MLLLGDVEEIVLMYSRCGTLALKLEDHNSIIMACREKVDLWMGRNYPETVILPLEGLNRSSSIEVPNSDCLVFADREYQVLVGMEKTLSTSQL